jgi:hypothetical protein
MAGMVRLIAFSSLLIVYYLKCIIQFSKDRRILLPTMQQLKQLQYKLEEACPGGKGSFYKN